MPSDYSTPISGRLYREFGGFHLATIPGTLPVASADWPSSDLRPQEGCWATGVLCSDGLVHLLDVEPTR